MAAVNSALHHMNQLLLKKILKQKTVILNCKNISQFYYIFDEINALLSVRD